MIYKPNFLHVQENNILVFPTMKINPTSIGANLHLPTKRINPHIHDVIAVITEFFRITQSLKDDDCDYGFQKISP